MVTSAIKYILGMGKSGIALAATLILAAGAGFLTSVALGIGSQEPTRTVTISVGTGEQGPAGPPGPPGPQGETGPQGPAGLACITGFSPGILVINAPGGQVRLYTCLGN